MKSSALPDSARYETSIANFQRDILGPTRLTQNDLAEALPVAESRLTKAEKLLKDL